MRNARWRVESVTPEFVIIRDLGPWDQFMTVTNDADVVVGKLISGGVLCDERRLLYYDSEGRLDELRVDMQRGVFLGFAPGPMNGVVAGGAR